MKNIILIILTFFTLSLFGQTEQPDEFRAPTGVIKSIKGTNFKKSIKVIGGKNVTVYEQPNTDTYNTFSIVNDSVRIQKWKLDTATNVFVTSNLNDIYLDNLVNKPSVDSRVVLDMVNDSLKVEVWDIINNTLLSTYYIDNVGNHSETITTITDTLVGAHLIANYNNEANTIRGIYESIIQVDSITNGYVITKEDGLKDTIKLNATGFYTLTSLDDTLALTTIAASKCPALTIAKLDSCNVAYLYMFNCEASHWELFKTPNIYTAGKTLFVDEVTGNDATAKKGCPTCAWKEINVASLSTQYENEDNISVNTGIYNMPIGAFEGKNTAYLSLENGVKINGTRASIGSNPPTTTAIDKIRLTGDGFIENNGDWAFITQFGKKQECIVDILKYKSGMPLYGGQTKKVILNVKDVEMTGGVFASQSATENSNISISVEDLYSRKSGMAGWQPGFMHSALAYGGQLLYQDHENNILSIYIKNVRWERPVGSMLYIISSNEGGKLYKNNKQTITIDNLIQYNIDSLTQSYAPFSFFWRSVLSFGSGAATFDIVGDNTRLLFKNAVTDYRLVDFYTGGTYTNCNLSLIGQKSIVKKLQTVLTVNNAFINSEIVIDGNYENTSGLPLIQFVNTTFTNCKIILKGNFTSTGKILEITGGAFDAASSIELQGTFKTTSPTLPAIDINHNRLFLKDCDIITGGGFSIDSATPVNVTVKPGCASNVLTSPNVTQLGTGIYVDPNFNN